MESLIAIASVSGSKNIEVLIDPERLQFLYGYKGTYRVVKTAISTSCDSWQLMLLSEGVESKLLSSAQISKKDDINPIDVLDVLGHGITVMPWQKLQLRFDDGIGSAICYLEDSISPIE